MKTYKELKNEEAWRRYGQSYKDCLEWVDREELSIMDEQIAKDFAIEVAKETLRNSFDLIPKDFYLTDEQWGVVKGVLSETSIPKI